MPTPLTAGNWKMNLRLTDALKLAEAVRRAADIHRGTDVVVFPPFPFLPAVAGVLEHTRVRLGAQTLHPEGKGAFTGEVAGEMLADIGCRYVLVGHSERRTIFREDDAGVAARAKAALRSGLRPVVCVGETLGERDAGQTAAVVARQLAAVLAAMPRDGEPRLSVAYEPVWAIGTGRTATVEQVGEVHALIRRALVEAYGPAGREVRILYGGSVTPETAPALSAHPEINGTLVGGASLKADAFEAIMRAAAAAAGPVNGATREA